MKFEITDDSGFLALVNSSTYNSFVKEDWELDSLFNHFVSQMNEGCFLIWQTSNFGGGFWNCEFLKERSDKISTREVNPKIANSGLLAKILTDFQFGFNLLNSLLKHATKPYTNTLSLDCQKNLTLIN